MTDIACPLCLSTRLVEIYRTQSSVIIDRYRKMFDVDVAKFFPDKEFGTFKCTECGLQVHHPALMGDSNFYDQMQTHAFYYEKDKPEFTFALNKIVERNPKTILEIGCGEGLFLRKLTRAYDVRASEFSQKSINKLHNAGIRMDEPGNKYDFIMFFQVLEHVKDVKGFLESSINKLNNNGTLLITVPNNESLVNQDTTILDYPPHHLTQWPKHSLEKIADMFNLKIEDYYIEPLRIEHLLGLISTRRKKFSGSNTLKYITNKVGRLFDRIWVPYHIDSVSYAGDTHGIVLKKSN